MKTIVNELVVFYDLDNTEKLHSQVRNHIKNASYQIYFAVSILVIIDNLFRNFFYLFGKRKEYTIFIIKNRPPLLSLLYKLITSLIILISFEKK